MDAKETKNLPACAMIIPATLAPSPPALQSAISSIIRFFRVSNTSTENPLGNSSCRADTRAEAQSTSGPHWTRSAVKLFDERNVQKAGSRTVSVRALKPTVAPTVTRQVLSGVDFGRGIGGLVVGGECKWMCGGERGEA